MWILGLKDLSNGTDYLTCLFDCCLCFAKSSSQLFNKKTNDCKFRYLNPGYPCLRNPESGKFSLVEYGILAFGIWNTAQRVDNPSKKIKIQIPSSTDEESGIQFLESKSKAWNLEFQTVLDYLKLGELS